MDDNHQVITQKDASNLSLAGKLVLFGEVGIGTSVLQFHLLRTDHLEYKKV
jgi:hypothetical protein